MVEMRNSYKILAGELQGKRPRGRTRRRWEDNIETDIKDMGCDDADWIELAQDMVK
jgi:hypothetical protein